MDLLKINYVESGTICSGVKPSSLCDIEYVFMHIIESNAATNLFSLEIHIAEDEENHHNKSGLIRIRRDHHCLSQ